MFWGLVLEHGKRYAKTVQDGFHVSAASLDTSTCDGKIVKFLVDVEGSEYLLANLSTKHNILQVPLDLHFIEGTRISFYTEGGTGTVHLSGYLIPDDEEPGLDLDDDDDEEEVVPQLVAAKGGKRKAEETLLSEKSKKALLLAEDSDEEESDDEDFDFGEEEDDSDEEMEEEEEDGLEEEEEDDDDEEEVEEMEEIVKQKQPKVATSPKSEKVKEQQKTPKSEKKAKKEAKQQQQQQTPKAKNQQSPKAQNLSQSPKTPEKTQTNGLTNSHKKDKKKKSLDTSKLSDTPKTTPSKQVKTGGVLVEDLQVGTGPVAKAGKMIGVYYEGRLANNNKKFDATFSGPPFRFRLGAHEVIKGWDVGVAGMTVGGKRKITVPPHMGYGKRGAPPDIPANATLVFTVELKSA